MVTDSTGQPPTGLDCPKTPRLNYADLLKHPKTVIKFIPSKPISYLHGEPRVVWEEEEVKRMIVNENLQYAVIRKFLYGWHDIQDLRKLIPKQCDLKGECNIGMLSSRHILIRASNMEDYVNLLSKPAFYITRKNWTSPMRTLKWDLMFNPDEETSLAIVWISFPSLPPNSFGEDTIFSLAAAVGKPLHVDLVKKIKHDLFFPKLR